MARTNLVFTCALLAFATGCTQSFRPGMSTETGNPPVINSRKIALVVTQDEVHVRGEAGAIMPPEAEVEITIVRTRDVTREGVADDGSFDVEVAATLDDVFEVRALLGGLRSDVVIVDRGGAMVAGGSGGASGMGGSGGASGMGGSGGRPPTGCDERTANASAALDEAIAMADRSCEVDADCMGFYRSASCVSQCFGGFFSEAGLRSLRDAVQSIDEGVCAGFEDEGCSVIAQPCVPPGAGSCVGGLCVEQGAGCDACLRSEITWRVVDAGVLPAEPAPDVYTLTGCNAQTRTIDSNVCATAVPQCAGSGDASIEELLPLLESEAVEAARAMGGSLGEPDATGGLAYEITIDRDTFVYRTCAGAVGVDCLPRGPLDELIDVLRRLRSENSCEVPLGADCSLPFQDGNCDAAIPVWWHDPESGACVQTIYGGCGGNSNRFSDLAECQAACPPPVSQDQCGTGRQLRSICTQCGVAGGCAATSNVCALECSSDSDCMGELNGIAAPAFCDLTDGVCQQSLICI